MKKELYTRDGWINAEEPLNTRAPFVILIGGRGIGKTYGVFKFLLENKQRFIYLRRSQVQIDACKVQELSPFNAVSRDMGLAIDSGSLSKYVAGFYRKEGENKELFSVGFALSTFANVRGFDASNYDFIVFDEFIPEKHERPINHEGEAFLNVLETINRNRELQGLPAVKTIMISNANKLDSPILSAIGALQPVDKMIRGGKSFGRFYDGDLEIYRYTDSPISDKKRDTALYRMSNISDFVGMALNNSFGDETYTNVKGLPIQEFHPFASTRNITVLRHKSDGRWYVVEGTKSADTYSTTPEQQREFRRKTYQSYEAFCKGKVYFSTAQAKVTFENIWR